MRSSNDGSRPSIRPDAGKLEATAEGGPKGWQAASRSAPRRIPPAGLTGGCGKGWSDPARTASGRDRPPAQAAAHGGAAGKTAGDLLRQLGLGTRIRGCGDRRWTKGAVSQPSDLNSLPESVQYHPTTNLRPKSLFQPGPIPWHSSSPSTSSDDERAFLTRNGRFERLLEPGRFKSFDPADGLPPKWSRSSAPN